jgi:hypothetical protein
MQPSPLLCRVVLSRPACRAVRGAAEVLAVSRVRRAQVVASIAFAVRSVASVTVGHRRSAAVAGYGTRRVRGASASVPAQTSSPNTAVKWDALKRAPYLQR